MTRRLQYEIEEMHNGKSIGMFLKEKEYSRAVIIELKKTKTGIRKNGVWAGVNEMIKTGDVLDICLGEQETSENIISKKCAFDILYEDEDILVATSLVIRLFTPLLTITIIPWQMVLCTIIKSRTNLMYFVVSID